MSAVNCILRNVMEVGEGGGVDTRPSLLLEIQGCVFLHPEKAWRGFICDCIAEGNPEVFLRIKYAYCITNYF